MTMPNERTLNLLQAGGILKELRADESLPDRIREEADRLLRHYRQSMSFRCLPRSRRPR